jgi:hypothetical protein
MKLFSNSHNDASAATVDAASPAAPPPENGQPIADYDGLDPRELTSSLHQRSQVELTSIEDYERAHQGRAAVLDKLRYLRENEPMPGYDTFSTEQVVDELQSADLPVVKDVREYERRHQDRRLILDAIVVVIRERLAGTATAG